MIEFVFGLCIILLVFFFPVVGIPILIFKRKKWWNKRWVRIVCVGWLIFFCIGVANSSPSRKPEQLLEEPAEQIDEDREGNSAPNIEEESDASQQNELPNEPVQQEEYDENNSPTADSQPSQQEQNNTKSSHSPNSGVNYTVSGYCNDGTLVSGNPSAKGKANVCYGHKGWRDY